MAVVIVHSKATFVSGGISFSPFGETGEGFSCGKIPIMPVKNIIPGQTVTKEKLQRAKELRRDMIFAEKILWQELRANKLGVHFRRQQVIAGFIVDFYCHKAGLVIEVDGDIHDLQQEEDARREKVLSEMGLRIVRFRNEEVVKDLSAVVGKIRKLVIVV
jgi:very-short-patch-repair endonuclease